MANLRRGNASAADWLRNHGLRRPFPLRTALERDMAKQKRKPEIETPPEMDKPAKKLPCKHHPKSPPKKKAEQAK
jgi:hypothetical protein